MPRSRVLMKQLLLQKRFDELAAEFEAVKMTQHTGTSGDRRSFVDDAAYKKWNVKVTTFLAQLSEPAKEFLKSFTGAVTTYLPGDTNRDLLLRAEPSFRAAKEDFENGWLNSFPALLRAEVFDDELEQAEELLRSGYDSPAAVIGRVVLETAIKSLCTANGIPYAKLIKMSEDLVKVPVYDALVHKKVLWLSGVGNAAAHGDPSFKPDDVPGMLQDLRRFLEEHKP